MREREEENKKDRQGEREREREQPLPYLYSFSLGYESDTIHKTLAEAFLTSLFLPPAICFVFPCVFECCTIEFSI